MARQTRRGSEGGFAVEGSLVWSHKRLVATGGIPSLERGQGQPSLRALPVKGSQSWGRRTRPSSAGAERGQQRALCRCAGPGLSKARPGADPAMAEQGLREKPGMEKCLFELNWFPSLDTK